MSFSLAFFTMETLHRRVILPKYYAEGHLEKFEKVKKELLVYINERVNKTSKISEIIEQPMPFQKTATQKIKRYLYK